MLENTGEVSTKDSPLKVSEISQEKQELSPKEKEIAGVWEAIQYVDRLTKRKRMVISEGVLREIHRKVMRHFHPDIAGSYRGYEVAISKAVFLPTHWSKVRTEMFDFGRELEERTRGSESTSSSIQNLGDVLELGAWSHYQFVRIHPFADGNGRVARLLTDLILKRAGLYYITDWDQDKNDYIDSLKHVDETGDLLHFKKFLAGRLAARYSQLEERLIKQNRAVVNKSALYQGLRNTKIELEKLANIQK